jgi:hypothetical protein
MSATGDWMKDLEEEEKQREREWAESPTNRNNTPMSSTGAGGIATKSEGNASADANSLNGSGTMSGVEPRNGGNDNNNEQKKKATDSGAPMDGAYAPGHNRSAGIASMDNIVTRKFTEGEIKLAKLFFGSSVDYSKVTLVKEVKCGDWFGRTINNSITLFGGYYNEDFSKSKSLGDVTSFLHEIVHVWQYQNRDVTSYSWMKAAFEHAGSSDPYGYTFDASKSYLSYGYEQQGRILEDYASAVLSGVKSIRGTPISDYEKTIYSTIKR